MNKSDIPPKSTQETDGYIQKKAEIVEMKEKLENQETEVKWDGSQAELVSDEDTKEFKNHFAGIKMSYVLKENEIYDTLRSLKSFRHKRKRFIIISIISCFMLGLYFCLFAIEKNWNYFNFGIFFLVFTVTIWLKIWYSLKKSAKSLTSGNKVQVETYPSSIEIDAKTHKIILLLNGTVKCCKINQLYVFLINQSLIFILPIRCIEPSVLSDVEDIILAGTIEVT